MRISGANQANGASSTTPSADGPEVILDREATLRRLAGDAELYEDLLRFFLEDEPKLWAQLTVNCERNEAHNAERSAHSLKGLLLNIDARRAAATAAAIEDAAGKGQCPNEAALNRLQAEIKAVSEAVQRAAGQRPR